MKRRTAPRTAARKTSPAQSPAADGQREASITALDALSARIAVLDDEGRIILVNEAWRDYAKSSDNPSDRSRVGDNYLALSRERRNAAPHAVELADGIESVLRGRRPEFSLEYPAEVGGEKWYHARVSQCSADPGARVLVAHEDISERVRLEREIVSVSAIEQQRFRQELHDGLSQQLTGLKFKASLLELHLQSKSIPEAAEAKAISELLNQATDEASKLARRMRPVEVEARGVMMALRELAADTEQKHSVNCQVVIRRAVFIHDNNTATSLFRIAADAVESAVTEGGARRIQISLAEDGQRVTLSVRDNGAPLKDRAHGGLRAHMMRYHARMIGGALEWRKETPKGVALICCFQKKAPRAE